jgi:cardiolipin synthase
VVWILVLYLLNTFLMLTVAIIEARRPAKALNWLVIGLILPVIGFVLYLITSSPVRYNRERLTSPHNESDALPKSYSRSASAIAHSLRHLSVQGLRNSRVKVLTNGIETYEKLIESIQHAERTIDLEYYIYRDDQIGKQITDLLIKKASAGVLIRFLRDGWGSKQFPRQQIIRMMAAGIECRTIFPLRFPWFMPTLTYRDHCKIVVIDGMEAFTGGINVGAEYAGLNPNIGFWRDTHLQIAGEAAVDLHAIFQAHWNLASPEKMKTMATKHISQNMAPPVRTVHAGWSAEWAVELGNKDSAGAWPVQYTKELQNAYVQTLEGNPGIPTQVVREAYFICLTQATQTIDITTPYFIPDADIIMAMKTAVARGVRVRLLVPHPRHVIPKIVGPASRTYFGELLEAGVHIYLYNKGMLHAKVMVIDGEISEVGSANYDLRSYRLNYEVCEFMYSADVARELTEQFEQDLADSMPLRNEDLQRRSRSQRVIDQAARLLSPLL